MNLGFKASYRIAMGIIQGYCFGTISNISALYRSISLRNDLALKRCSEIVMRNLSPEFILTIPFSEKFRLLNYLPRMKNTR